jgi:ubiquinone/menaquinone biosynthesis C-methylase UbiE
MSSDNEVSTYYSRGNLLDRLNAALKDDGVDPARPSIEALAPYDQFHTRGLEATEEMVGLINAGPDDHILDIGSGIGGPARYFAKRLGCKVTGIDLTPHFCELARHLTHLLDLEDKVEIKHGNALAMPFADAIFDGAYSMNVSMNIADKATFYREIYRVLKPGGWLMLSEIAKGDGGMVTYPTAWAQSEDTSFLSTPEETRSGLIAAGFEDVQLRSTIEEARAFGARARAMVERGEKPPHRAIALIHGESAKEAAANMAHALSQSCAVPVEVVARKKG